MKKAKTYTATTNPCRECGGTKRYVKGAACANCTQRKRAENRLKTEAIETTKEMHKQRAHVKLLITPYEDVKLDYWDRAI